MWRKKEEGIPLRQNFDDKSGGLDRGGDSGEIRERERERILKGESYSWNGLERFWFLSLYRIQLGVLKYEGFV